MSQSPSEYDPVDIMQQDVEEDTGADEQKPDVSEKMARLEAELTTLKQSGSQQPNHLMQQLLANPAVAEVLRLQQSGKRVTIGEEGATPPTPEPKLEIPSDGTPVDPRKLIDYLDQKMTRTVQDIVQKSVGGLNQKLEQVTGFLGQQQVNAAQEQISKAQKQYKDFNQYIPQMKELSLSNPGLSAEELYLITKTRSGQPVSRDRSIDTERPDTNTAAPAQRSRKPVPAGNRGMDVAFDAAWNRYQKRR